MKETSELYYEGDVHVMTHLCGHCFCIHFGYICVMGRMIWANPNGQLNADVTTVLRLLFGLYYFIVE